MIDYKDGYINRTGLYYDNISSETDLEYTFPNGDKLVIENPLYLNLSLDGHHRHITKNDWCYTIDLKRGTYVKFDRNVIPV